MLYSVHARLLTGWSGLIAEQLKAVEQFKENRCIQISVYYVAMFHLFDVAISLKFSRMLLKVE